MPAHPACCRASCGRPWTCADFPGIHQFLDFWRREIDAVIHSVTVSGVEIIAPAKVRKANSSAGCTEPRSS